MSATLRNRRPRSRPPSKPFVLKYWMTAAPHSIGKDQPLAVAHRLMKDHDLRHLPVLEGGKLVGLVSERDLYFLETVAGVDPEKERVEEGMSQDVYCASPDAPLHDVIVEMATHKYGCTVVIEHAETVGVFTTTDALNLLAQCLDSK
ncbi:MAG TPA: CBS domain-containing protein [Polyangiaceae bacterium]